MIHALFGGGREVQLDPVLTYGFAEGAVGHAGALLPSRRGLLLSGKNHAEEGEVFVVEGLGQVGCLGVQRMPAEVGLPCINGL